MTEKEFVEQLLNINVEITPFQLEQLEKYYVMLIEKNKVMNLTGITDKKGVYLKHFYDSITLIKGVNLNEVNSVCDIGTGAGFPGVVLKIIYPHLEIDLVDSLNKRIIFLNEVIKELNLTNVKTIHTRIEDFKNKNKYDVVTCRAVSHLRIISELGIPLVREKGYFIPMKANISQEIEESKEILRLLESEVVSVSTFNLPYEKSVRNIVKIRKNKHNPAFPRKYSDIKNKPIQ